MGFVLWSGIAFVAMNCVLDLLLSGNRSAAAGRMMLPALFPRAPDPAAIAGGAIVGLIVLAALLAPWLAPFPG